MATARGAGTDGVAMATRVGAWPHRRGGARTAGIDRAGGGA